MKKSKNPAAPISLNEALAMRDIKEGVQVVFRETHLLTATEAEGAGDRPLEWKETVVRNLAEYRQESAKQNRKWETVDTVVKRLTATQAEIVQFAEKHGVIFSRRPVPDNFFSCRTACGELFTYDDDFRQVTTNIVYSVPSACPQHVWNSDTEIGPEVDAMMLWDACEYVKVLWRTGDREAAASEIYNIGYQWAMIRGLHEHADAAETGHYGHKRHGDVARETHRKENERLKRKPDAGLLAEARKLMAKPPGKSLRSAAFIIADRAGSSRAVIYRKILAARKAQGKA